MSADPRRLVYLDTIRGLAAFAVVLSHYVGAYGMPWGMGGLAATPLAILWDGYAAVSMFFVLSGFVLALPFFRPGSTTLNDMSLVAYCGARVCRIQLPFCAVIGMSLILSRLTYSGATVPPATEWIGEYWNDRYGLVDLIKQACYLIPDARDRLLPQDWTLSVELKLSFLLPVLVLIAVRSSLWLCLFAAISIVLLNFPYAVFHFSVGVLLAKHAGTVRAWVSGVKTPALFAIGLVAIALYGIRALVAWLPQLPVPGGVTFWYVSGFGALLILGLATSLPKMQKVLSLPALEFLGKISYSVYLTHFAMLLFFVPWFLHLLARLGVEDPNVAYVLGLLAFIVVVLLVSAGVYYLVERPSIWLSRYVKKKVGSRPVATLTDRASSREA